MPGFNFELSQLVNVPGKDQQGRVCARMEYVGKPSIYQVTWIKDDLDIDFAVFEEAVLFEAQKPKPAGSVTLKVEVDDSDLKRATEGARALQAAADAAGASIDRLPRNVLNMRKPASKRRTKR